MERLKNKRPISLTTILLFILCFNLSIQANESKIFTQKELIKDAQELAFFIETIHPEPYGDEGRKILFHRRLQKILHSIPAEGMVVADFFNLLLPFVAAVKDGHTYISLPYQPEKSNLRIPLAWDIVEEQLYLTRVYFEDHRPLLGSILMEINHVPYPELVKRQSRLAGAENKYGNLHNLKNSLSTTEGLAGLLPELSIADKVLINIRKRSGEAVEKEITFIESLPKDSISLSSRIALPAIKVRDPDYAFIGENKKAVLLRLDNLISYREAFEAFRNTGYKPAENWAKHFYRRFHNTEPPNDLDATIQGIPALTNTLKSLAAEMQEAETELLIIDARRNGGGHSIGCDILVYFIYGLKTYQSVSQMLSVEKLSPHLFDFFKNRTLENLNQGRSIPLRMGDYLFDEKLIIETPEQTSIKRNRESWIKYYQNWSPTFAAEVRSGQYETSCKVQNVVVITSPRTFSGGFWAAVYLKKAGAEIVGVPSGQAGNHFGSVIFPALSNTDITLSVPTKQFLMFPHDPEKGRLLKPDHELTLKILRHYNFDPNADILQALDSYLQLKSK
jgi:hypothetical protein